MMVTVEDMGPCRKKIKIQVPAETVSSEYQDIINAFTKNAKVPGFRPGNCPPYLIEKRYAKDISKETRDRLVNKGYRYALSEKKIDVIAILDVTDVHFEKGQPMEFSVILDVPPQFDLPTYLGISLQSRKEEVQDKEIDDTIQPILERNAKFEDISGRPVRKGDLVQVDFDGVSDGQPIDQITVQPTGLGQAKDFWVMVDENAFLPEFGRELPGVEAGADKQVQVDFPADFSEKSLAGRKAIYSIKVKAIREKKLPKPDAELLKKFGVDSESQLRENIKRDLQSIKDDMEKRRLRTEILKHLLANTKMDVPETVTQRETESIVYDIVSENRHRGIPPEKIQEKKDEIFETASRSANDKVKIRYITHAIAEKEKVKVSEEELSAQVGRIAARYGMQPAQFRSELQKRNALEQVEEEIRFQKTVDFLLEQAQIKGID